MTDTAAPILSFFANHLWQSAALSALLAGLLALEGRLSGKARHALAFGALAASALMPLAMLLPANHALLVSFCTSLPAGGREAPRCIELARARPATAAPDRASPRHTPIDVSTPAPKLAAGGPVEHAEVSRAPVTHAAVVHAPATPRITHIEAPPAPVPAARESVVHGSIAPESASHRAAASRPAAPPLRLDAVLTPAVVWTVIALWLGVAAVLLVRVGLDIAAAERLRRRAAPVKLPALLAHLVGEIEVRESDEAPGPMVAGVLQPTIVLPMGLLSRHGPQDLIGLLEHERAHVERGDIQLALVQRLLTALFWWSPAMHWIGARVAEEREMACDEAAAVRVGDARAFARTLTDHAEARLVWGWPRLVVGATRGKSQLVRRVRRLLERAAGAAAPERITPRIAAGALLAAVAALALATPRLEAQESGPRRPAPPAAPAPRPAARPATPVAALPPEAPEAPKAAVPPEARAAALAHATDRLEAASKRVEHARDDLDDKADDMKDDPSKADEVRAAAQELAQAQRELRSAAREVERNMGGPVRASARGKPGVHVEVSGPDEATVEEINRAAEALGEAFGAMAANFNFDFDIDPQALDGIEGIESLPALSFSAGGGPQARRDSPLATAARMGNVEMVRVLVDAGADVNTSIRGEGTVLMMAVRSGDQELVKYLLDHGANPNLASPHAGAPLSVAVQSGDADMVRALISGGADVNAEMPEGTALVAAVRAGDVDLVRVLIDLGASLEGAPTVSE